MILVSTLTTVEGDSSFAHIMGWSAADSRSCRVRGGRHPSITASALSRDTYAFDWLHLIGDSVLCGRRFLFSYQESFLSPDIQHKRAPFRGVDANDQNLLQANCTGLYH